MTDPDPHPVLREEATLRWCFLEDEPGACVVVSERMELIYINDAARGLVPGEWFGKRCFEVLPIVDEACAFHCPKIRAVSESVGVVYCEERVGSGAQDSVVFGVGLIPLGPESRDRARAVLVMLPKPESAEEGEFRARLLGDAGRVQRLIASHVA